MSVISYATVDDSQVLRQVPYAYDDLTGQQFATEEYFDGVYERYLIVEELMLELSVLGKNKKEVVEKLEGEFE